MLRLALAAGLALALAGCVGGGGRSELPAAGGWGGTGSIADAGTLPEQAPPPDTARYDEVGYASWYGPDYGGKRTASGRKFDPGAITAAHRTLPLGSFAEVTALDSGRTILVEITDRGPDRPGRILDLSQAAARLLATDAEAQAPVRVRRVMPTGRDQAALRRGEPASARMDAPPVLLRVLRRRLPGGGGGGRDGATKIAAVRAAPRAPRLAPPDVSEPPEQPAPEPRALPRSTPGFYIQVASFSTQDRARMLARQLGNGRLEQSGGLWRVRLGPYGDADSAEQARDEVVERGYGDARILRIP